MTELLSRSSLQAIAAAAYLASPISFSILEGGRGNAGGEVGGAARGRGLSMTHIQLVGLMRLKQT